MFVPGLCVLMSGEYLLEVLFPGGFSGWVDLHVPGTWKTYSGLDVVGDWVPWCWFVVCVLNHRLSGGRG